MTHESMTHDYYAELSKQRARPTRSPLPQGLVPGFVDECTVRSTKGNNQKNEARKNYMQAVAGQINTDLVTSLLAHQFGNTLRDGWLGVEVSFTLRTPWYSKDDRPFHVLDNPVRKDRVFGVPYMSASSWKGMLRWACWMQAGLRAHLEQNAGKIDGWREPDWILHLFGNEKGEQTDFHQGALVFYPTWFNRLGFEVINPHSREGRAGTQPIYYEVVPAGTEGTISLLYAPLPNMQPGVEPQAVLPQLLEAIETLLTTYGISAKRTVGWGTATISAWKVHRKGADVVAKETREALWQELQPLFSEGGKS